VLYEMLTGVHPFRKGGPAETAAAILADEAPPLGQYMEDVPECRSSARMRHSGLGFKRHLVS